MKLNIGEIIVQTKNAIRTKQFKAKDDIRKLLVNNCKLIAQEYDPFVGELKSLYLNKSNFIVFREETLCRKGNHVHDCFKLKIIGPYKQQLYYTKVVGPRVT